ncbi:MAG: alkaline phosphatase family protein [Candidatus Promineofilum sp.]|nr:alkaline phosphatase family protein [Promineifilum sp.]
MTLLIIGFDGATFDLIKPWARDGYLPNLAGLMRDGVIADLASTLPPVTSPAWPTFMTGVNPGKHGVFDFIQPHGENFTLVNSTQIRQPTLWKRLSELGYRVGVLNVPVTYPPQEVNGFMVTDILSPRNATISHPADLINRYEAEMGAYRVAPDVQYKPGNEREFIADIYDLIDHHGRWALKLAETEPVDMLMVHFIAMDIAKHALWRFMDHTHERYEDSPYEHAIRDGYARVDAWIGRLMDKLPANSTTIVMSDHGFGPLKSMVNLNVFFMQRGLLKLKPNAVTQLKAWAFRHGITPASAYQWLSRLGLQNSIARVSKKARNDIVGKFLSFDSVDWSRTIAYSMGHVGQVYLNRAGREPHGIVTDAEYDRRLAEVSAALAEMRDDEGHSILTNLVRGHDVYSGPYAERGPDLHLELDHYAMIACPLFATEGRVMTSQIRGDSGCHRREGIFIASGAGIQRGLELPEVNIVDLAPTIMHLLGEPVPRIMDGRVLVEGLVDPAPVRFVADEETDDRDEKGFDAAESEQIEERLRGLGYL